jgi:hypothetical protein
MSENFAAGSGVYSTNTPIWPEPTMKVPQQTLMVSKFAAIQTPPWMNRSTPGFWSTCVGFMMYSFTVRPSWVMVFSVTETPGRVYARL